MNTSNESQEPQGRNPLVIIGGFTVLAVIFAAVMFNGRLLGGGAVEQTAAGLYPTSGPPLVAGDAPYDFTLTTIDGETITLSELHGQPVVLNFWASWCGPCRIEAPDLQAAHEAYAADGLVLIGVNQAEAPERAQEFIDEFGWTFRSVLDPEADVPQRYGFFGTLPVTVFISPEGEITAIHRGPVVGAQLEALIAEIVDSG